MWKFFEARMKRPFKLAIDSTIKCLQQQTRSMHCTVHQHLFRIFVIVCKGRGRGWKKKFAPRKNFRGGLGSRALHAKRKLSHYFCSIWNFFFARCRRTEFRAAN